jgi:hypothetical protein
MGTVACPGVSSSPRNVSSTAISSKFLHLDFIDFYLHITPMNSYEKTEDRIQEALASIDPNIKPNYARLACEFKVPYGRQRSKYLFIFSSL